MLVMEGLVYWTWRVFTLKRANGSPRGFAPRDDGTVLARSSCIGGEESLR